MRFPPVVLLAASILAPAALAQQHEAGQMPEAASLAPYQPAFQGGVRVAVGDVDGDGQGAPVKAAELSAGAQPAGYHNGFVSRFSAGGRAITPLDDPQLKGADATAAGRYTDITLKRGTFAPAPGTAPLHGLPGTQGGTPVDPDRHGRVKVQLPQLPSAPGHSVPRIRMAQPYVGAPSAGVRAGSR